MNIKHWDKDMLQSLNLLKSKFTTGGKVLDVGAGDGLTSNLFDSSWIWDGIDPFPESENVVKGDAHKLPFKDNSFDIVLSICVFEHLHSPWVAIKEISRVLKDGGYFLGMCAFLEPEHANSYFHMTKAGVSRILDEGNFDEVDISPVKNWNVFTSMRVLPIPGSRLYNIIKSKIIFSLRRFLINFRIIFLKGKKKLRAQNFLNKDNARYAGSFRFVAKKSS